MSRWLAAQAGRGWRALRRGVAARYSQLRRSERELTRLARLPRYVETTTDLPGFQARIPDGASFAATWSEVFGRGVYDFHCDNDAPRIVDCGANVGVSCLYFKTRFPKARVTAFEPDPRVFDYLGEMMARAHLADVELIAKAVWTSATTLEFASEGADAGRIGEMPAAKTIEVTTVRLRDYLAETIDFLKIDIEGAETAVLRDSADLLDNVRNLFVEYHSFADRPQTLDELLKTLTGAGFRLQIHPVRTAAKPFCEVGDYLGMDLQLNVFAFRPRGQTQSSGRKCNQTR